MKEKTAHTICAAARGLYISEEGKRKKCYRLSKV